jgi:hypothetical protein
MLVFVAQYFYNNASWKNKNFGAVPFKTHQTKSICIGTMKLGQHLRQTLTSTQKKFQIAPTFGNKQFEYL